LRSTRDVGKSRGSRREKPDPDETEVELQGGVEETSTATAESTTSTATTTAEEAVESGAVHIDMDGRAAIPGRVVDVRTGLRGVGVKVDRRIADTRLDLAAPSLAGLPCITVDLTECRPDATGNFRGIRKYRRVNIGDGGDLDHRPCVAGLGIPRLRGMTKVSRKADTTSQGFVLFVRQLGEVFLGSRPLHFFIRVHFVTPRHTARQRFS
jgi:hypothetical protein